MISVDSLIYKIDLKLNKLSTSTHQSIPLEDKILALNEAQIRLIKSKINDLPSRPMGLDSTKKKYEDIQVLMEIEKSIDVKENKTSQTKRWYTEISNLDPKYMFYVDAFIIADKATCKNRRIDIRIVKHADITMYLNNNHYKPSFEYQETLATVSKDKLEIYTDGTFTPKKTYLSYIRYPQKIDYTGYEDFEGNSSTRQDSELADYLEDELVDLAVQELAMSTENVPAVEFSKQRSQIDE